ncbi:nucleoprotein TPR isoform X1, partial [Tachysurus ichikawai]
MATALQQVLERNEISRLTKAAQNKLEKFLTEKQRQLEELRTSHESYKADCEQQTASTEKKIEELQEQLVSNSKECETLKEEKDKLTEELKKLKAADDEEETLQQVWLLIFVYAP